MTAWSQVRRPNHYATESPITSLAEVKKYKYQVRPLCAGTRRFLCWVRWVFPRTPRLVPWAPPRRVLDGSWSWHCSAPRSLQYSAARRTASCSAWDPPLQRTGRNQQKTVSERLAKIFNMTSRDLIYECNVCCFSIIVHWYLILVTRKRKIF